MIRNWIRQKMVGRYGLDQLYFALFFTAVVLELLSLIRPLGFLAFIAYALLIVAIFRVLSKKIYKRRRENDRFLRYWWPIRRRITSWFHRLKSMKDYKFFKCPGCGNTLRVPRGKGKLQITCPKCGERIIKKT